MKISLKKQGVIGKVGDALMYPLMILLQGTWRESPQRTHRWNNQKLRPADIHHLENSVMVSIAGDARSRERWQYGLPFFHMPIFGGWKQYIVLTPTSPQNEWYVGWIAGDVAGVSRIPLQESVRVLKGQYACQFFGINEHGEQITLAQTGDGIVGQAQAEHTHIPLL